MNNCIKETKKKGLIKNIFPLLLLSGAVLPLTSNAQLNVVSEHIANPNNEPPAVHPVPHPRQLKWQETEFYAFFHYGMNTYTNKEWGYGDEDEQLFKPTKAPNPEQWLKAAKDAGMKGGIAVVKHHDGFCLWPTETTSHNVTKSGNDYGRNTNIPRDFAKAARKLNMKYGFYVSPWDRNSEYYGTDKYVKDVFLRQCAELAKYGSDQFEMWFDGANGGDGYYGGKRTKISVDRATYYDTPNLRDTIHKVCPDCVLWGEGGEARWIGNEAGWAGETNWSTDEVIDKEGWLHTGDLALIDDEGNVTIKGRSKNLLLGASGQNIFPEEIEDKLNNMPYVSESIIIQQDDKLVGLVHPDYDEANANGLDEKAIEEAMNENLKQLNNIVESYSRVAKLKIYPDEFAKTPKKSIKRYLYKDVKVL